MRKIWLLGVVSAIGWAQTGADTPPPAQSPSATSQAVPGSAATPPQTGSVTTQAGAATPQAVTTTPVATQTADPQAAGTPQIDTTTPLATQPGSAQAGATAPQGGIALPKGVTSAPQTAMADSLEKQRASVQKQVAAVAGRTSPTASSFFTVPWIDTPAQFNTSANAPACDPMPDDQLNPLIEENSKREGVKADLIRAVIGEESGRRPCAVSPKGAQGLMQLMPATSELFGVHDPFDPKQNVEAGTKFLKQLLEKYKDDMSLALSAYNAGSGRVDRDGGVPAIPETTNYVTDILSKLPKQ